jgi:class 3 adenylate cyclase
MCSMPNSAPEARAATPLVVAFVDLSSFAMDARRVCDEARLADLVDAYYERLAVAVHGGGGRVVKYMGDGALITFPTERADDAVLALLQAKRNIDAWLAGEHWDSRLVVKVHTGTAIAGAFGAIGDKRFDIIGDAVNVAARLQTRSFAISAETFRLLSAGARKSFKKHTPPITYIPLDAAHPSNLSKWG